MSKKIKSVYDSPCWSCPVGHKCSEKRKKNRNLDPIVDMVWDKAEYDRKDCPLYIAINALKAIEENRC